MAVADIQCSKINLVSKVPGRTAGTTPKACSLRCSGLSLRSHHPCLLLGLPLGGEQPIEVSAAGVAWRVLQGENIGQDVVALTARLVLTHQLGLEEGGPTSLQSLHPSHVRLKKEGGER